MLHYEYLHYLLHLRSRWYLDLQVAGVLLRREKGTEEQEKVNPFSWVWMLRYGDFTVPQVKSPASDSPGVKLHDIT